MAFSLAKILTDIVYLLYFNRSFNLFAVSYLPLGISDCAVLSGFCHRILNPFNYSPPVLPLKSVQSDLFDREYDPILSQHLSVVGVEV